MRNLNSVGLEPCNRRQMLKAAGGLAFCGLLAGQGWGKAAEAALGSGSPVEPTPARKEAPFVKIGIFLSTFQRSSLEERLDAVRANGLNCVQLSMDLAGLDSMPDEIPSATIA